MAAAKTGRRGGAGDRSAKPTGAAVPASRGPAAALPEAQPTAELNADYALFVRQRKDSVAHAVRTRREQGVAQAQQIAALKARRAYERALADHERAIDEFWRRFFRRLPRQRTETSDPNRGERRAIEAVAHRELAKVSRKLAAYSGPIIDRAGRRGVYVNVRYLGAKVLLPPKGLTEPRGFAR